jgi:hypothetical protein
MEPRKGYFERVSLRLDQKLNSESACKARYQRLFQFWVFLLIFLTLMLLIKLSNLPPKLFGILAFGLSWLIAFVVSMRQTKKKFG